MNCLTSDEHADIICFISGKSDTCGTFSVIPRAYEHKVDRLESMMIPYTVSMSSKFKLTPNSYAALITDDLTRGAGTKASKQPWIKVKFEKVMKVERIEVAAPAKEMEGRWGLKYLRNANVDCDAGPVVNALPLLSDTDICTIISDL